MIWNSNDLFANIKNTNVTKSHEALSCFIITSGDFRASYYFDAVCEKHDGGNMQTSQV